MADDAQVAAPEGIEGSVPPNGAADATPSSSAPADQKELLDRLAQMGRERTEATRRAQELEARLGYVGNVAEQSSRQLQYLQNQMSKKQWDDFEARLANMSPVDAANERARVAMEYSRNLEQRLVAAQTAPPAATTQRRQETDEEYSRRRGQELVQKANQRARLTGADALKIEDMPTEAWTDEDTFLATAFDLAKQRASTREEGNMANPKKFEEAVAKEVAKQIGANRSLSAAPSPGAPEPGSEEVAKMAASHATNKRGPGTSIAELRKHREQIAAKIGQ